MREPSPLVPSRISTASSATLHLRSGNVVQGALHRVSVNGLHLHMDDPPREHGPCRVGLRVTTEGRALEVQCLGSIISRHDARVVVHIESVAEVDSLDHLRALVHDAPLVAFKKAK